MLIYVQMSVLEVQAFYINMDHYSTFRRHIQPKSTEGIAFFRRNMGAGGTYYETVQSRNHRRHRHGRSALRYPSGEPPLVSVDRHRGQQPLCGQDLRGGHWWPLGPGCPHARGGQGHGGAQRGNRHRPDCRPGGLRILRGGHEEGGNSGPGGGLCPPRVPRGLQ